MGFSTLNPQLDTLHIATRTQCNKDPSCSFLIACLIQITDISKLKIDHFEKNRGNDDERQKLNTKILSLFDAVFAYICLRVRTILRRGIYSLWIRKHSFLAKSEGKSFFFFLRKSFSRKTPPQRQSQKMTTKC